MVELRFKVALWVLSKISIWSVASPVWIAGFRRTRGLRRSTVASEQFRSALKSHIVLKVSF